MMIVMQAYVVTGVLVKSGPVEMRVHGEDSLKHLLGMLIDNGAYGVSYVAEERFPPIVSVASK